MIRYIKKIFELFFLEKIRIFFQIPFSLEVLLEHSNKNFLPTFMMLGGARGVVVIVVGNGHGDMSSNPGRNSLHFT